jgi:hypothetical protein
MPGRDNCFSGDLATKDDCPCVNPHSAARFSAIGVQSTGFSRVFVPLRKSPTEVDTLSAAYQALCAIERASADSGDPAVSPRCCWNSRAEASRKSYEVTMPTN